MATLPSIEHMLLGVRGGLGLPARIDLKKSRFTNLEMSFQSHTELASELLLDIFQALEMDERACEDALGNLLEWDNFHKALELKTWTGNASEKQVVWHMLAYAYVPGLARRLASWSLAGIEAQQPFDAGMPGGEFWFLPNWDAENNTLKLPVPQVLDWLLDLLEAPALNELGSVLGKKTVRENPDTDLVRTLQNWRKASTPQSAEKIKQLFPYDEDDKDYVPFTFAGVFSLDCSLDAEAQFQAALAFAQRKKLPPQALRDQIPMSVERLMPIVDGTASEDEKQEFVRLVAQRYPKPTMRTIRQRLRVARMMQVGYTNLLKTLCGDGVDATCTDPEKNKLLQLIALFNSIYNLTVAAWKHGGTAGEQDAWFEARLAPWDKADLLLSITPSQRDTAYLQLAQCLTRKFMAMTPDSPLEDLVPTREQGGEHAIERRLLSLQQALEEDQRLLTLVEKVRHASPWRALEAEPSYWVISQLVHEENLSPNARALTIKRLRALAATPGQTVRAIVLELGFLLNGEARQRPKDIQLRVQLLLDEAQASQGYEEWKAPLLRLRAKHWLMQNEFACACKDFKAALEACHDRGFGGLRGEVARDGFAAEIAVNGFVPVHQEVYHRNMAMYGMFPEGLASIADTAVRCEAFFWNDLYHPYPGVPRRELLTKQAYEAVLAETFELIETADWDGLRLWLKRHAKQLRKANFKDARCDSVLLSWLKLLDRFGKVEKHMFNWRHAIALLLEAWPEQAKIADFKRQTPLHLVADNGDAELTKLLAPLSDLDVQDVRGCTVLHAAASGRSPECVSIVVDRYVQIGAKGFERVTPDEKNTALHTAVRFGQPQCVQLILEGFPSLASRMNATSQTPLAMAVEILQNLDDWRLFMGKNNRRTGSKEDFEAIIEWLESESQSV